jgi:sugar phosphate isomerase/epimerase
MDLVGGAIGVEASPAELIQLAAKHGFESVQPHSGYLGQLSDQQLAELLSQMRSDGLVWGAASMPVDFRGDQSTFERQLKDFPKVVAAYQRAGVTRISTWLKPYHESLTYNDNFRQHVSRLKPIAKIAGDHGLRFGLEYVGTKTLWTRSKYAFIHTMRETKELFAEVNEPNVGFVLDSWHWYCAGETKDDILSLKNEDVVACDLNDAPAGIPVDEQVDNRREVPAATGVIDLKAFLSALVEIGYDGPVRAEPFNQPLNRMDNDAACAATAKAIAKAFATVD